MVTTATHSKAKPSTKATHPSTPSPSKEEEQSTCTDARSRSKEEEQSGTRHRDGAHQPESHRLANPSSPFLPHIEQARARAGYHPSAAEDDVGMMGSPPEMESPNHEAMWTSRRSLSSSSLSSSPATLWFGRTRVRPATRPAIYFVASGSSP